MRREERIIVAGFGGQGVMMIGQVLSYAANLHGLNTLWFPSYGPETRGGTANCSVSIATDNINSPVISKATTLMALNKPSLDKFLPKLSPGGVLLYNSSLIKDETAQENIRIVPVPINDIAIGLGNIKVANMVLLGAFIEVSNLFNKEQISKTLEAFLSEDKQHLLGINISAIQAGMEYVRKLEVL